MNNITKILRTENVAIYHQVTIVKSKHNNAHIHTYM